MPHQISPRPKLLLFALCFSPALIVLHTREEQRGDSPSPGGSPTTSGVREVPETARAGIRPITDPSPRKRNREALSSTTPSSPHNPVPVHAGRAALVRSANPTPNQ